MIKEADPNVCTVFYYNSVCDFPQYKTLYDQVVARPDLYLRDEHNNAVFLSCAGFANSSYPAGMPIYNFIHDEIQDLWGSECYNATKTGYVDGCFSDRAVDGVPLGGVAPDVAAAYNAGHIEAHRKLQKLIGDGPLIANHAYGKPFDNFTATDANSAMIESCSSSSLAELQACKNSSKLCQCHATGTPEHVLPMFLIGAYGPESGAPGSYFGFGAWDGDSIFDEKFAAERRPAFFDYPLGKPLGDATFNGTWYYREFAGDGHNKTTVLFNPSTKEGTVQWASIPPPPPPPAPVPGCSSTVFNGGNSGYELSEAKATSYGDCCEQCSKVAACAMWTFYSDGTNQCHLHSAKAKPNTNPGRISGIMKR